MEEQGSESGGAAGAAPPTGQAGLDLIGLTKVFPGGTVAVDDVNLHVDHGEYVVLLGRLCQMLREEVPSRKHYVGIIGQICTNFRERQAGKIRRAGPDQLDTRGHGRADCSSYTDNCDA